MVDVSGIGFIYIAASAISAYDSGYNHGCSDAHSGGHPYLDSPGKGPSFHTGTFMQGYDTGYSACFTGSPENSAGSPQQTCSDGSQPDSNGNCPTKQPTQQQGKTIEEYCDQYHDLLALSHPCNTYVIGNHILRPGSFFIVCNLIKLGVSAHTRAACTCSIRLMLNEDGIRLIFMNSKTDNTLTKQGLSVSDVSYLMIGCQTYFF